MNGIKKLEKEWKKGTTNIFQLLSQLDRHGNVSYKSPPPPTPKHQRMGEW